MLEFTTPTIHSEVNGAKGTFVIEPLERGYGTTLGNALRRVMLSSLPGTAAAYIKIDGADHEFSVVHGVKEDITEVVLNVKGIVAKMEGDGMKTGYIDVVGPHIVTAADIKCDSELEIINPEQKLATVRDGEHFHMELGFITGRGYSSADKNKEELFNNLLGVIPVDSIFTPIYMMNYKVESTRVGSQTNFDKLTVEVQTNGSISPDDAMALAASIIIRHFECIADISKVTIAPTMIPDEETKLIAVLDMSIDDLDFSVRSYNCLKRAGVDTVGDLTTRTEQEVMQIRNLGKKSFDEIKDKLISLGQNFKAED